MHRSSTVLCWPALALLLGVSCSSGTETDNPAQRTLVSFAGTECKTEAARSARVIGAASVSREAIVGDPAYDGLACVTWATQSNGELSLQVFNFAGACSVDWRGTASAGDDGALGLVVENPSCMTGRCGTCLYDFEFRVSGHAADGLRVSLGARRCPSDANVDIERELTLSGTHGVACRYAMDTAFDAQLGSEGRCGASYSVCPSVGVCADSACAEGLSCVTPADASTARCLAACSSDADCLPAGVSLCVDGACQVPKLLDD